MTDKLKRDRKRMIEDSAVDIFAAASRGLAERMEYPLKLESMEYAKKEVRERAEVYILDSGIQNPDITNRQVIEKAIELEADVIIPKDYLREKEKTTESVQEFFQVKKEYDLQAEVWIPLQPPYDVHYREMTEAIGEREKYVLGGIAKLNSEEEKIREIEKFREEAGWDVFCHALGVGGSRRLMKEIRKRPELLDSLDLSTPIKAVTKNEIMNRDFQRQSFQFPEGENSTALRAMIADFIAYEMNHVLNPDSKREAEISLKDF